MPQIARALYYFPGDQEGDLAFEAGDLLEVYEWINEQWWTGKSRMTGLYGSFPASLVEVVSEGSKEGHTPKAAAPEIPSRVIPSTRPSNPTGKPVTLIEGEKIRPPSPPAANERNIQEEILNLMMEVDGVALSDNPLSPIGYRPLPLPKDSSFSNSQGPTSRTPYAPSSSPTHYGDSNASSFPTQASLDPSFPWSPSEGKTRETLPPLPALSKMALPPSSDGARASDVLSMVDSLAPDDSVSMVGKNHSRALYTPPPPSSRPEMGESGVYPPMSPLHHAHARLAQSHSGSSPVYRNMPSPAYRTPMSFPSITTQASQMARPSRALPVPGSTDRRHSMSSVISSTKGSSHPLSPLASSVSSLTSRPLPEPPKKRSSVTEQGHVRSPSSIPSALHVDVPSPRPSTSSTIVNPVSDPYAPSSLCLNDLQGSINPSVSMIYPTPSTLQSASSLKSITSPSSTLSSPWTAPGSSVSSAPSSSLRSPLSNYSMLFTSREGAVKEVL